MQERFGPVDAGGCGSEIEALPGVDEVGLRHVLGEHGAELVLLAGDPVDEEHLDGSAAIPVALLVVRADLANPGTEALRDEGGEVLVAEGDGGELPLRGG